MRLRWSNALRLVLSAAVVVCTLGPVSRAAHVMSQAGVNPVWRVAQRLDKTRVVVLLDGGQSYIPQVQFESLEPAHRNGLARLLGLVVEIDGDRAATIVHGQAAVGDRWLLDAGRDGWFHLTVEHLVLGYAECGEGWGVMATIEPSERAAFAAVKEKYFVARPATTTEAVQRPAAVGGVSVVLSTAQRSELESGLGATLARALPDTNRDVEAEYAHHGHRSWEWKDVWHSVDQRLGRGEGVLEYDVQSFQLAPDREPRLFVRARWTLDKRQVYYLTAWVRLGSSVSIETVDTRRSFVLRFDRPRLPEGPLADRDQILNVLDTDRDGWGELLMLERGGDGLNLELREYPTAGAPTKVIAILYHSC